MKAGEIWKSKEPFGKGIHCLIRLHRYLGTDMWLAGSFLSDETEKCAMASILSGELIHEQYVRTNDV
jgi:hypothetical protein